MPALGLLLPRLCPLRRAAGAPPVATPFATPIAQDPIDLRVLLLVGREDPLAQPSGTALVAARARPSPE